MPRAAAGGARAIGRHAPKPSFGWPLLRGDCKPSSVSENPRFTAGVFLWLGLNALFTSAIPSHNLFPRHYRSRISSSCAFNISAALGFCVISAKASSMVPKNFFRWVAWLLGLAVALSTLTPIDLRPATGAPVSLERFAAFGAIGAAFSLGYPRHRIYIIALLLGSVGFLEFAQNYVPGRHGRLPDGAVKASGALLGVALATLVSRSRGDT